ncbi:related to phosphoglycerate mutase [Cephalotrichum gorgonifer]|uniref:Related to phosphoglycerate mutase n=1 Tax=Cephalotrichum gorgonifer TaxID=2041049 RepID=A0AAE8N415_9PEZI|nr:related to phosphoglycerate mutase [Cephalotrichum gorgonifer]
MADAEALTPRVFIARHGETEWAKNGRHTGKTDIELTPYGIKQVHTSAKELVGAKKLLDPARLAHVFVSPRIRAQQTFHLLFEGANSVPDESVTVTEDIAEWDYGDYEGLKTAEIHALRKSRGLDAERPWSIWKDGSEGGESPEQIAERLDRLIAQIRDIQRPAMKGEKAADVVVVAHGHILRVFAKRWLNCPVDLPVDMVLPPGGIGILSYKNNNVNEPAIQIGIALPVTD